VRAARDHAIVPHREFILQDQFQELGVRQPVGRRFLQTHVEALGQAAQTESLQRVTQGPVPTIVPF